MTLRYLPLAANLAGVLLLIFGCITLPVCAFKLDPLAGWSLLAVVAIVAGVRLATRGEAGN